MPMYTAASPGNLLPKFSDPKTPPGPAGTIAHRASVLQKATVVVAAGKFAAGWHCVVGGVATPAPRAAPTNTAVPRRTATRARVDFTFLISSSSPSEVDETFGPRALPIR